MTPVEIGAIANLLDKGGTAAVITGLVFIVAGVLRGWWVPGWYFRQAKTERDEAVAGWRETLLAAHSATKVAERATGGR